MKDKWGMISEDKSQIANLPQGVVQKSYPGIKCIDMEGLDDSISGIDNTIQNTVSKIKGNKSDSMY